MKRSRLARRYARALFELALEKNKLDEVASDINLISEEYQGLKAFQSLIDSPVIPKYEKQRLFESLYKARLQVLTYQFVSLLIRKNREVYLEQISFDFHDLLDEYRGILRGTVYSVIPLTEQQLTALKQSLDRITDKNVVISQIVDENLLGGLVVKIDDKVYDNSLRHQLERLRENLSQN